MKRGFDRGELIGIDGYDAVLMEDDFAGSGNEKGLETLLGYSVPDTIILETLTVKA